MQRLCRTCEGWHSLDEPWPVACADHFQVRGGRSELPRPMVISDSLDGIKSMISGERFDSKSRLRQHYRANGVIEVGNDPAAYEPKSPARPKIKRDEIREAIAKVRGGYRPHLPAD